MMETTNTDKNPSISISDIFLVFLRLGITAFGGSAMVAYIKQTIVKDRGWLGEDSFKRGLALCQTIPGATAMQTCAYVGLELRGVPGAAAAFLGFGFPAFLLMLGLSAFYVEFRGLPAALSVFAGLRVLIVAIMANATLGFGRSNLKRWRDAVILAEAAAAFWFGVNPILVVLASALLGILLSIGDKAEAGKVSGQKAPIPLRAVLLVAGFAVLALLIMFLFRPILAELSLLMMRIDLFAFGGGFASVPLMLHEIVDVRHWLDQKVFMDGIALGQITPGPIVITSTFVGYLTQGVLGALVATASIFFPSFMLVVITAPFFARLNAKPLFRKAVTGILSSFVGLLISTTLHMGVAIPWTLASAVLAVAAFAALLLRVDILWVVLGGGLVSFFLR